MKTKTHMEQTLGFKPQNPLCLKSGTNDNITLCTGDSLENVPANWIFVKVLDDTFSGVFLVFKRNYTPTFIS